MGTSGQSQDMFANENWMTFIWDCMQAAAIMYMTLYLGVDILVILVCAKRQYGGGIGEQGQQLHLGC